MYVGDPRQFQSRVLSGPGQPAVTTSFSAASHPPQQPQPYAPSYLAPNQSAYAAPSVFPTDPRAAARGYAPPAQPQLPPPPQQSQMDAAAKIQAIRAAIAAQTAADPISQPQPSPAAQPQAAEGRQRLQQQLGMSAAAAASQVGAGSNDQLRPPASAGAAAASPAALPLPMAAFDLVSILQNAGVKPAVLGAPPSGSAGPNTEEKPQTALQIKAESNAKAATGFGSAGLGGDEGAVGPATAVETDAQRGSTAEQTNGALSSRPNIESGMMQLLGTIKAAAAKEGAQQAQEGSAEPNIQSEMEQLLGNTGGE